MTSDPQSDAPPRARFHLFKPILAGAKLGERLIACIGALLGIKPATVGSTLRRSLAKIQNETEAYFVDR